MLIHEPDKQPIVKDALAAVNSELESLASEEEVLRDMRISLAAEVNNSTVLASVNKLPPEILARIFGLSKIYCAHEDGYRINGLAGVCVYWRMIALGTADLWTHVDVSPQIPRRLTELLLGRSKEFPVHVHILDPELEKDPDPNNEPSYEYPAESMMIVLESHLRRISTLYINSNGYYGNFIFNVLNVWSNRASTSLLKSLVVDRSQHRLIDDLWITRDITTFENIEKMLHGLSTLHLRCTALDWDSSIYSGLLDLQLSFNGNVWISTRELTNVLTSCPALTTLKIEKVQLEYVEGWVQPPIVMQHLEFVHLAHMLPGDASSVLSLITLPGPRVELGIILSQAGSLDSELAEFFVRSSITTLYQTYPGSCNSECDGCLNNQICEADTFKASKFFPQYLPHIHTLILDTFDLRTPPLNQSSIPALPPPLWPRLQNLVLVDCRIGFEVLRRLVYEIGVQNLHIEEHTGYNFPAGYLQPHDELQKILASLQEVYPHLHCEVSDLSNSTKQQAYRTVFDWGSPPPPPPVCLFLTVRTRPTPAQLVNAPHVLGFAEKQWLQQTVSKIVSNMDNQDTNQFTAYMHLLSSFGIAPQWF
ncbi:hypothetical protein FRC09_003982 [Ceratobasidium sp. 395]|nr:hypothetical protein FRC09_003982 [Ceratobasidium sp. 395]